MNWEQCRQGGEIAPGLYEGKRLSDDASVLLRDFELSPSANYGSHEHLLTGLGSISHPSLVVPRAWKREGRNLRILFEAFQGHSLHAMVQEGLAVRAFVHIVSDVVEGLEALHAQGFVHGGFDRSCIWKSASESGVLLTPGLIPGLSVGVGGEFGSQVSSHKSLSTDLRSQDMERLGLFVLSVILGCSEFSFPPTPSEADIARILLAKDRPLAPMLVPLLLGRWDAELLSEFRNAVSLLELRADWPARHVHTGEISREELSRALADAPDATSTPARRSAKRPRGRRSVGLGFGSVVVALLILAASGTAILYMSPPAQEFLVQSLRDLGALPEPYSEGLEGLLVQGADSNSGLALRVSAYRTMLARSPGHAQATAELRQLITSTREEVEAALAEGRLDVANQRLGEAVNLFPEDAEFRRQLDELSERRMAENLFVNTLALVQEGDFSDQEGLTAIEAYREVVRLWPDHDGASNALVAMARHFVQKAQDSILAEDVANAMMFLEHATRAASETAEVAAVREQIQRERTMLQEIETLLEAGSGFLASEALVNPPGANAAETYGRVLATDPDNPIAVQGLRQVTSGVIEQISRATALREYAQARNLLTRALQSALDEAALAEVAQQLEVEQQRSERLETLLRDAEALLAQGFISAPEDDNLLEKLFEVQTLDSDNQRAAQLAQTAAARLTEVAEDAWNAGFQDEAREYLRLALTLVPDHQDWIELRESWTSTPS